MAFYHEYMHNLLNCLKEHSISDEEFAEMFRLVAGPDLSMCAVMKNVDFTPLRSLEPYMVGGGGDDYTYGYIVDTMSILVYKTYGKTEIKLHMENSKKIASMYGYRVLPGEHDCLKALSELVGTDLISGVNLEGDCDEEYEEEYEEELNGDPTGDLNSDGYKEDSYEDEVKEEPYEEEVEPEEVEEEEEDADFEAIGSYYAQYCNGIIQELLKRYSAMYASGYEVSKPAGLLTEEGIVRVSGSKKVVFEDSVSTTAVYSLLKENVNFKESDSRSVANIANDIYNGYTRGNSILYFPNKHIEFAYGLCAPSGENQDSVNTYTRHADASNWSKYLNGDLTKAVKLLVKKSTVIFVSNFIKERDISYKDPDVMNEIGNYLKYLQHCLSLSFLFSEYKVGVIDGDREVASFKLRVCDPEGDILEKDLTWAILQRAFMGGLGKVPFSYSPRVDDSTMVIEYAHEFNHDMAQATPLFAYKALEALKSQELSLSIENLILGMAEDGSILKVGKDSISLSKHLSHYETAGSQAGKGVMTLNLLASGIASRRNIIYLDRKPDMASLLKYMAPKMAVINGGNIQPGYDCFKQWQNMVIENTPEEVIQAFGLTNSWNDLGDLVYMRLLKLSIALLMVRGSGHIEHCFGGEDGILLIVDEFSNFQKSYMSMFNRLTSSLPPTTLEKAKKALSDKKMTEPEYKRVYSNKGYYALSYINSIMADLDYLAEKKDAGYDPMETARSDVFIIGQSIEKGMFNYGDFKEVFGKSSASGRYKSIDANGLTKGSFDYGDQSIPTNYVNFKTADAFFGRNMDDGRDKYLAQTSPKSKAKGRLDDKASNFAYLDTYTEFTRKKIVSGTEADNIGIASSCKYFKPFLILNSSGEDDDCVRKMFERVRVNAGISPEELIMENPSYTNPDKINEAIGFVDYLKSAGINDYASILTKSTVPLNFIVQEVLHYPGDWFQFVTDFSPEWLFTIKDVVDSVETGNCGLFNPITNPILREYVEFDPNRFVEGYEDRTSESQRVMQEFLFTESSREDYSNKEKLFKDADERMSDIMGDNDVLRPDEEIDLDMDNSKVQSREGMYQPIKEAPIQNSEVLKSSSPESVTEVEQQVQELLARLDALGYDRGAKGVGVESIDSALNGGIGGEVKGGINPTVKGSDFSQSSINTIDFTSRDEAQTLAELIKLVTADVLKTFGGAERITSFKVIGGSIAVNGYFYTCRLGSNIGNVPYDVRKDLNSGNISKLFNYAELRNMKKLRDLEFDSEGFTYDYVSSQLGFGKRIRVDKFFSLFRHLQVLVIGKTLFERDKFKETENDLFYKPRKSEEIADISELVLLNLSNKSWKFTKDLASKKNCNLALKILGITFGTAATLTTGTVVAGSWGVRSAAHAFAEGAKDLFRK